MSNNEEEDVIERENDMDEEEDKGGTKEGDEETDAEEEERANTEEDTKEEEDEEAEDIEKEEANEDEEEEDEEEEDKEDEKDEGDDEERGEQDEGDDEEEGEDDGYDEEEGEEDDGYDEDEGEEEEWGSEEEEGDEEEYDEEEGEKAEEEESEDEEEHEQPSEEEEEEDSRKKGNKKAKKDEEPTCDTCECIDEDEAKLADDDYIRGTDFELRKKIKKAYYAFRTTDMETPTFLKEVFTPEAYHALRNRRTVFGGTFWDVIRAGASDMEMPYGVYAPDPEAYEVFKPLFNVLINDLHGGFAKDDLQPCPAWGNFRNLHSHDPEGKYVVSIRLRVCRNLEGFPFSPLLSRNMYLKIEEKVKPVLEKMPGKLEGEYLPLEGMSKQMSSALWKKRVLMKKPPKAHPLAQANVGRFWPSGRGVHLNRARNFMVWVGYSDHLTIIAMSPGHNIQDVYTRLRDGVLCLEQNLEFARDDRLGYLTVDPGDVGTTLKMSYRMKLPLLTKEGRLEELAEKYNLAVKVPRKFEKPEDGEYFISNKKRVGLAEYEVAMEFQKGIGELIWQEEVLELKKGQPGKVKGGDKKGKEEEGGVEDEPEEGDRTSEVIKVSDDRENKRPSTDSGMSGKSGSVTGSKDSRTSRKSKDITESKRASKDNGPKSGSTIQEPKYKDGGKITLGDETEDKKNKKEKADDEGENEDSDAEGEEERNEEEEGEDGEGEKKKGKSGKDKTKNKRRDSGESEDTASGEKPKRKSWLLRKLSAKKRKTR